MVDLYDVLKLLKDYNIIIYMRDRKHFLYLLDFEIRELYKSSLIAQDIYLRAVMIIKNELESC